VLRVIQSLYTDFKAHVKGSSHITDIFDISKGLSPLLFSLYVNDLESYFSRDDCLPVDLDLLNLFLIMYAEDTVIFSETIEGLQHTLDSLEQYCSKWKLEVNVIIFFT